MARDSSVIVLGMGVDDFKGTYGTTAGLVERYGLERVFDTPLSEDAMTGVCVGAALAGVRPIHVHIRMDFLLLAMNQLVNIAAKSRYMYGGAVSIPIVVRAIIGRSWGQGAQHSQALHSFFMHVPGLKVVAPTTPYDAKGCLIQSIQDDDPVIFVEHRLLYSNKGYVPQDRYTVPTGKARVLASGDSLTLVGISHMVVECLRAAKYLQTLGLNVEVIDPVWLSPLDMDTIIGSVDKTGRLLVVDNAWTTCGASAEIIARIVEEPSRRKELSVRRMGFEPVICPTTRVLEDHFYPDSRRIAELVYSMVCDGKLPTATWDSVEQPEIAEFKGPF